MTLQLITSQYDSITCFYTLHNLTHVQPVIPMAKHQRSIRALLWLWLHKSIWLHYYYGLFLPQMKPQSIIWFARDKHISFSSTPLWLSTHSIQFTRSVCLICLINIYGNRNHRYIWVCLLLRLCTHLMHQTNCQVTPYIVSGIMVDKETHQTPHTQIRFVSTLLSMRQHTFHRNIMRHII